MSATKPTHPALAPLVALADAWHETKGGPIAANVARRHEQRPGGCACGARIGDSIDWRWHLVNQAISRASHDLRAAIAETSARLGEEAGMPLGGPETALSRPNGSNGHPDGVANSRGSQNDTGVIRETDRLVLIPGSPDSTFVADTNEGATAVALAYLATRDEETTPMADLRETLAEALHREMHAGFPCHHQDDPDCWEQDKVSELAPAALDVFRAWLGEQREVVARALALRLEPEADWDQLTDAYRGDLLGDADAVVDALRGLAGGEGT